MPQHSENSFRWSQISVRSISPYLIPGNSTVVFPKKDALSDLKKMVMGSNPVDGKRLILDREEYERIISQTPSAKRYFKLYGGTREITNGNHRYCLWLDDKDIPAAMSINAIASKVEDCRAYRQTAGRDARRVAKTPHRFSYSTYQHQPALHIGNTIGNRSVFVPFIAGHGFVSNHAALIFTNLTVMSYNYLFKFTKVWAETVAGRLATDKVWRNGCLSFPIPKLTGK